MRRYERSRARRRCVPVAYRADDVAFCRAYEVYLNRLIHPAVAAVMAHEDHLSEDPRVIRAGIKQA